MKEIATRLDGSLEAEKAKDDFLAGLSAIVAAIRAGKIECRVYRKDKFHAKACITHGRAAVVALDRTALSDLRKKVEKQLITDHLRALEPPAGMSPVLKCWMELN